MLLQGLFIPLCCPFRRDGSLYLPKLEHNVRRYSLSPAAGLLALPPGGEATTLSDAEAEATLRTAGAAAVKTKVLLAGVERGSVAAALLVAEAAAGSGFDAILLAPPADWPTLVRGDDRRELVLFFQAVADRSTLPVVIYNAAGPAGTPLPIESIGALAKHPNILGLAEAELSPERLDELTAATSSVRREVTVTTVFEAVTRRMLQEAGSSEREGGLVTIGSPGGNRLAAVAIPTGSALKTRTRQIGFQVLSAGPAHRMLQLLEKGLAAAMPTLASAAPQGCFEAYAAWKDGDPALSAERGARLQAADELLAELGPAGVKYACDWNGYFGGQPRLPRLALLADQRKAVEQALGDVRN